MKFANTLSMGSAVAALLGICLVCTPGMAQDANQKQQQNSQQKNANQQSHSGQAHSGQGAEAEKTQLPKALTDLDLKDEQKQKLKKTLQQHDQKLQETWQQFHAKHMEAVELEAAWAAAVRDTLNEEDQSKFDQNRKSDRQRSADRNRNESQAGTSSASTGNSSRNSAEQSNSNRNQAQNERTNRDASNNDRDKGVVQTSGEEPAENARRQGRRQGRGQARDSAEDSAVMIVAVMSPVKYTEGSQQTSAQKQQCSEICEHYSQKLQSTWNQIERLHTQLVRIEADRITSMEEVLTDQQLKKLKDNRSRPSSSDRQAESS